MSSSDSEESSMLTTASSPSLDPITEDEIRAVLLQEAPVTTHDLVVKFRGRLKKTKDKRAFVEIISRISKIQKANGSNYVVLRDESFPDFFNKIKKMSLQGQSLISTASTPSGPVTEDEIKAFLLQKASVTTQDLVAKFRARLKTLEAKVAFAAVLRRISKIQKTNGRTYVVLRDE